MSNKNLTISDTWSFSDDVKYSVEVSPGINEKIVRQISTSNKEPVWMLELRLKALRIYEEGIADFATIDWAMTELGGFKMGPFTLMDFIGNDVNYAVTESVFEAFYYDPRYKPSFTQKRHSEAGWLGRKTKRGYFNYEEGAEKPLPNKDKEVGSEIVWRILVMLINEAADALFFHVANRDDIDTAMTKGVNYPKGLLQWADEIGINKCVNKLDELHDIYREDRYRCSLQLRRMVMKSETFY